MGSVSLDSYSIVKSESSGSIMKKALLLWALLNVQVKQGGAELAVAKLFSSGMVLQEAPAAATIFGSYTEAPVTVTLAFEGQQPFSLDANLDVENLRWDVVLPPVSSRSSWKRSCLGMSGSAQGSPTWAGP